MEHQALTIQNWSPRVKAHRFSGSGMHLGLGLTKLASANSASAFLLSGKLLEVHFQGGRCSVNRLKASKRVEVVNSDDDDDYDDDGNSAKKKSVNDPYAMNADERREWRRQIREVLAKYPDNEEDLDQEEKKAKMQKLLADYPLVVNEEDPKWPEDADGWGFSLGQFFDKISIKNVKKDDDDDDDLDDSRKEIVWQDDEYIRPIKDIKTAEWEEILYKDISPLVILVHNRYKRPKENEKIREELEKAVHIIWNCRLPSPRCVAVDAVVETDLVSALKVSKFPEIIFSKAGRVLYREREIRTADEFSKIMAYFYYGAAKPPCLDKIDDVQELIPAVQVSHNQ